MAASKTPARRYAEGTTVSLEKTQAQIKAELIKRGATAILFHDDYKRRYSIVGFQLGDNSQYLVFLPMPAENAIPEKTASGWKRDASAMVAAMEQEKARLHRSMFLLIKAKLVAIDDGLTSLEREFFADRVITNEAGKQITVYEWYAPQIEHLRQEGLTPPLIPGIAEPRLLPGAQKG